MPGNQPWVSVIIPVYNRPKLATEAVRSVLLQSYPQLECILVDDGSSEAPQEACRLFAADPRFRYLPIAHSGMPGAVRNRGVEAARYGLLAFLDSDDLWLPRKLELQVQLLQSGESGFWQGEPAQRLGGTAPLVHSREVWLRGEKIISQKGQRFQRRGDVFAEALKKCMIGPSTVLMRRDVYEQLGGFREDLEIAEDYELWLRLTALYPVDFVEEPLIVKRAGHGQQLSEKYGHIELFRLKGLEDLVRRRWFAEQAPKQAPSQAPHLQQMAASELADKCAIYAAGCRKRGREQEAQLYEAKAAEYSP
ncbi:MAG: glycosyltransferase family 2 protein [Spirochaetaceae bacterium]|nr:glycosyltransferase family 2 protein [Spirochaetia bacterium]MCF7952413.1 glycosyltransferase family 2 protein [Spirochaetaceae bacterium]